MLSESPPNDRKKCPKCGNSFTGEPDFCGKCGTRLTPVSVQQPNTKSISPQLEITTHPQHAMFRANPQHIGEYDSGGFFPPNTELWRFKTGNNVRSSPALWDGIVYFGSLDGKLYAIDAMTGKAKWVFKTGNMVYSSPAVSNGIVYFGSWDNNLYAIDAVTGKERWRLKIGNHLWRAKATNIGDSSPALSDGVVYVGSNDKNLYAIDAMTGKVKWRFKIGYIVYSSPAVSNNVVYIGSDYNDLFAIDAIAGTEKWRFATRNGVHSSPAVSNDIVYFGSEDKNLYAIDAVTGTEKWRFTTGNGVHSSPAVSNGVVYIGSNDNNLYAIDAVTGMKKWQFKMGGWVSSSPAVSNGVVYVGSNDNSLYAIGTNLAVIQQLHTNTLTELKEKGRKLLGESNKFGQVPEHVESKLDAHDIPTIESAIKELEAFRTTLKPNLSLSLDQPQLIVDDWDRMIIQIMNRGNAHIHDMRLTLSDEFDTKWIKTITLDATTTTSLDIAIRPKIKGKIPLEVTAMYRDSNDKEYCETHGFWIDVIERGTSTIVPTEPPSSSISQVNPRPYSPNQLPAELSDRYTESEFIGKGGFARVFKAKRKDGKYVAVKIPITMDTTTGKSFIAEMQNWTNLKHPNIVKLYDFNIMPMPYFEEELCDGALADRNKPIGNDEVVWIIFNICEGLKFAHAHKIIHRDLKPQNILLKNSIPKISDWGLSRILSESVSTTNTSFTWYYAAPEQINNKVKNERTDIWQLGVILYELITGVLPFKGDSLMEIGMNIATKDPVPPGEINPVAKAFDVLVMKCLQKDPSKRFQSVLELQKDLAMYLRKNYAELLKTSVSIHDSKKSADYCGELVMINMQIGDIATAYKYLLDFIHYSKGDVRVEAQELSEQLKMRMEMGVTEIPPELIQKADLIVHQVKTGFRNRE